MRGKIFPLICRTSVSEDSLLCGTLFQNESEIVLVKSFFLFYYSQPYQCGPSPEVLKWKPTSHNSVDFKLKIVKESGEG